VSAGLANYPTLTKTNYNQWALLTKIKMELCGLWGAVGLGDAEFQVDRMALDVIRSAVPPKTVMTLVTKDMALELWISIKTM
jgi:hypothetical protein